MPFQASPAGLLSRFAHLGFALHTRIFSRFAPLGFALCACVTLLPLFGIENKVLSDISINPNILFQCISSSSSCLVSLHKHTRIIFQNTNDMMLPREVSNKFYKEVLYVSCLLVEKFVSRFNVI